MSIRTSRSSFDEQPKLRSSNLSSEKKTRRDIFEERKIIILLKANGDYQKFLSRKRHVRYEVCGDYLSDKSHLDFFLFGALMTLDAGKLCE